MSLIASATTVTINYLVRVMCEVSGIKGIIEYAPPRNGDVRDNLAAISAAAQIFDYEPSVELEERLGARR